MLRAGGEVGDVLYVPRGFVHEATTQNEASLHLTVAVPSYDWTVSRVLCDALQTRLDGPGGLFLSSLMSLSHCGRTSCPISVFCCLVM